VRAALYRAWAALHGLPTPLDKSQPDECCAQQSQARRLGDIRDIAPGCGKQTSFACSWTGRAAVDGVNECGTITTLRVGKIYQLIYVSYARSLADIERNYILFIGVAGFWPRRGANIIDEPEAVKMLVVYGVAEGPAVRGREPVGRRRNSGRLHRFVGDSLLEEAEFEPSVPA
jgi:hypothetical protein